MSGGSFVQSWRLAVGAELARFRRIAFMPAFAAAVIATSPLSAQPSAGDPLEGFNRGSFEFNLFLDGLLLEPIAHAYRLVTPGFVRTGVSNFLFNLKTPVTVANDLLQGEPHRATESVGRFMFNTILGFGGLVDVGGMLGMPERHTEDFGQTLAVYGVGPGPYIMMPLLGPSNPRDLAGLVVDFVFDPLTFVVPTEAGLARRGAGIVSFREENIETIDELERTSIDFYAATRTLAQQFRANEIRNGEPAPLDDVYGEDIYDESIFEEDFDDPENEGGDGG
ncbi:MAG: VacJ family lipoprotein [Alphaproteobacteria bacterium]|nr:VacJ family lipoprotein [Alphaproteobacteria bacterium]